jgi:RNA polymerase sigma-70 factor, ECF subfamily
MNELPVQPSTALEVGIPHREAREQAAVLGAYDAWHEELYGFLIKATRDPSAAEDLLQEAYLRLRREARSGQMPEQARPWLYRVAANLAVSRSRRVVSARRWLERFGMVEHRAAIEPPPEAAALRREAGDELVAAMSGISTDARTALLLSAEGFSGVEIAAAIGRSDLATRTLLCRARLRLRRELSTIGGDA